MRTLHMIRTIRTLNNVTSRNRTSYVKNYTVLRHKNVIQSRGFTAGVTGGVKQVQKQHGKQQQHEEVMTEAQESAPRILITGTV